ncbi:MAG TPA: hypothetical protein VMS45_01485, partial [Gemmatimonadaceae bacterium]|nr:hypothetical protein [Gemmatimonadaceae bacterium]
MRTRALFLLFVATIAPRVAAQQPPAPEPVLDVVLPADSLRATLAPAIVSTRMLEDRTTRELLNSGFPARLHYRLELWEASWPFDSRSRSVEWDVIVKYDPLAKHYIVARSFPDRAVAVPLGSFAELHDAQDATARAFVPAISPPTDHKRRYYYFASLEVES